MKKETPAGAEYLKRYMAGLHAEAMKPLKTFVEEKKPSKVAQTFAKLQKGESVAEKLRKREVVALKSAKFADAKTSKALRQLGMKVEVLPNGHACLYVGANLVEFELNDHEMMRRIVNNLCAHFTRIIRDTIQGREKKP